MIELVLRIGFSLLIVLGLMWAVAKLLRRPLTSRGGGNLAVLTRQQLSRTSSVAIVQVADRAFILGVTDTQVSMLGETDLAAFERHPHPVADHRTVVQVGPDDLFGDGTVPVGSTDGRLHGSVLAAGTWRSALDFLRERTARR